MMEGEKARKCQTHEKELGISQVTKKPGMPFWPIKIKIICQNTWNFQEV